MPFSDIDKILNEIPEITPSPAFRAALMAKVQHKRFWQWPLWVRVSIPAAAVAAALLMFIFFTGTPPFKNSVSASTGVTCRIEGMMCQLCAKKVEHLLVDIPGVREARVNSKNGTAQLILEEGKTVKVSDLTNALKKTKQYRLKDVEFVSFSHVKERRR